MVEILTIRFGSIENYYKIAIDKESHSNKKVTVTVLYVENTYPDRYLVGGFRSYYVAR